MPTGVYVRKPVTESFRKSCSLSKLGYKNPMFGRHANEAQLRGLAMGRKHGKKFSPEALARIKGCHLGTKILDTRRYSEAMRKKWQDAQYKENIKRKLKICWEDPIYRKKVLGRTIPTDFERRIARLIAEYQLPYRYVGDGEFSIGGKYPDFVDVDGSKCVIEVYWSGHKLKHCKTIEEYERPRRNLFARYGFRVIYLNENDFCRRDWKEHCLHKIKEG